MKGITARLRARKRAKDQRYAAKIRPIVERRDGYCRYFKDWPDFDRQPCEGNSEWAHFGDKKRFKTRGMAPEKRHTTAGSLMLCSKHHREYDAGKLRIVALSAKGCDGGLCWNQ